MKLVLSFAFLLCIVGYTHADVIQVNNNVGASADYSSLQSAINAANFGDTLYIAGSPNYYDGSSSTIRLNKRLTLIGPGYFLGQNIGLASNITAKLNKLVVGTGADNSVIMGLDMTRNYSSTATSSGITNQNSDGSTANTSPSNISFIGNIFYNLFLKGNGHLIQGNYLRALTVNNVTSNTLVQNNIFSHGIGDGTTLTYTYTNLVFRNNIMNDITDMNGATIINNIFVNDAQVIDCDNGQIKNNVFTTSESSAITSSSIGNTVTDNLYAQAEGILFIDPSPGIDSEYKLSNGSPASGVGFDGVDAGAFGGTSPYIISGIPPLPIITDLTTTGSGTPNGGIRVRVKAKAN